MNKQQLANKIWATANQMRSKIEAYEYKDFILGFIFYKFLSEREEKFLLANGYTREDLKSVSEYDPDVLEWVQGNLGYFIGYKNLFSTWLSLERDFDVSNVRDGLSAFSRCVSTSHRGVFDNVFETLQTGLSKLGDSSGNQTKAINGLLQVIKEIPMDKPRDYDVLGFVYEYLISMFAANAGKKAGEFYTPHEVSSVMSEIIAHELQEQDEIRIYDPTSGSGSLLINIGKAISRYRPEGDKIKYYAQELKANTFNLTRMNLIMRGIKAHNIVTRNADTLAEDWPVEKTKNEPLHVDAVVSNPPYSQVWDPSAAQLDPRFSGFGVAPKSKADYAFLLHDLYHLKSTGTMTIVLPHGVLFRGGEEGAIRQNLVDRNHIDAIIGLPSNIFFGTGIPTIILVLKKEKKTSDILFIDASKGFTKEGKNNKLRACDIKKIVDTFIARNDVPKYARVVTREEIQQNDYNLNIPRYVDSSETPEQWDLYASMFGGVPASEVEEYQEFWDALPGLKGDLFKDPSAAYLQFKSGDVDETLRDSKVVQKFKNTFEEALKDLPITINSQILGNKSFEELNIVSAEDVIVKHFFTALEKMPLVDKYVAYQTFSDSWETISGDLEVLAMEKLPAAKIVDPNMVVKKKDNKEVEVQEGWKGRILPFDLVQEKRCRVERDEVFSLEEKLANIPSELSSILEELSEDDREMCNAAINEEGDAFVGKEVTKLLKSFKEDNSPEVASVSSQLTKADDLLKLEKTLKKKVKDKKAALELQTKSIIEGLSEEEVFEFLRLKWVHPLYESLMQLPEALFRDFANKLNALKEKYSSTFFEVDQEIAKTETELSKMLDDLVGNDYDMKALAEFKALLGGKNE